MSETQPLPLGIGAGVYRTAEEVPEKLLNTVTFVTLGSFTSDYNHGNRDLPVTELFDPKSITSLNAKSLPNQGLPKFWEEEMLKLSQKFKGKQAELRLSLSPRKAGELGKMKSFLKTNERWGMIDLVEINLSCPNHRGDEGLHPVLARDPQAVNDLLKEWSGFPGPWAVKIAPDTPEPDLFELVQVLLAFKPTAIVSANTRLNESNRQLAGQKMSVEKGGFGGTVLLGSGLTQMQHLRRMIPKTSCIMLIASGGITDAASAEAYQKMGADEGQMTTVPYFMGDHAVERILMEQYFG